MQVFYLFLPIRPVIRSIFTRTFIAHVSPANYHGEQQHAARPVYFKYYFHVVLILVCFQQHLHCHLHLIVLRT